MICKTALLIAACALPVTAHAATHVVPLKAGPAGTFTAPVSVNGAQPERFIVDLGAGVSLIPVPADGQGAPFAHFTGWRMTGERLDGAFYHVPSLSIGPLTASNDVVGHWSGVTEAGVDGMISAREFASTPFTFDFVNRQIVFEDSDSLKSRVHSGLSVPLAVDDDRGKSLLLFADLDFGHGQRGECLIDTGQFNIQVNKRYMEPLGVHPGGADVLEQDDRVITHLPDVALAAAPSIHAPGAKVIFRDLIYDCVIGNSFWVRNKIATFDIAARRIYVQQVP
jgi:hypothetical protein